MSKESPFKNSNEWHFKLSLSPAEKRILEELTKRAESEGVTLELNKLKECRTIFTLNSDSFYSEDRKEMIAQWNSTLTKFIKEISDNFFKSRLSDNITLGSLTLEVKRSVVTHYNSVLQDFFQKPSVCFMITIKCYEVFEEENKDTNNE